METLTEKKILILVFYYNRPFLVKNSLKSIIAQNYKNWEVAFVDDGSDVPGEGIVKEMFPNTDQFTFYRINDTVEDKLKRNGSNGSLMGEYANKAIYNSNADYVIMLCDDDALYVDYLKNLNQFYHDNPDKNYAFSHIKPYDPAVELPEEPMPMREHHINQTEPECPYYRFDMSQVSFRRQPFVDCNILFPFPYTVNIDAEVFLKMYSVWGNVHFTGFISQYKAFHVDNLSHRIGYVIGGKEGIEVTYRIILK